MYDHYKKNKKTKKDPHKDQEKDGRGEGEGGGGGGRYMNIGKNEVAKEDTVI